MSRILRLSYVIEWKPTGLECLMIRLQRELHLYRRLQEGGPKFQSSERARRSLAPAQIARGLQ